MMKQIILLLASLLSVSGAYGQVTKSITVTNTPTNIVASSGGLYASLTENTVTPTAVFSVTPAGSTTAANLAAGAVYQFQRAGGFAFAPGDIIGTVVATTSGPFTFILTQYSNPPPSITITGGGGGSNAWSALTASANTNTGVFSMSQPGTFTNAAMNENNLWTLTGGGSCTPFSLTGTQLTDGLASCVNLPTSGVTNGFTNALAGYGHNTNANSAGIFGWTGVVGVYTLTVCDGGSATFTKCWGGNLSASDGTAKPAFLTGNEIDLNVLNNATKGYGVLLSFRGNGQPAANTFPAAAIQGPGGTGKFTNGFWCQDNSIVSPFSCLEVGKAATGVSQDSLRANFTASDGSANFSSGLWLNQDHFMWGGGVPMIGYGSTNGSFGAGYGIALTATATLPLNTLVKIDTAHADAVVICTTADASCDGFIAGAAANTCQATSTLCGVVTTPGSFVHGILGTGSCAIGNYVIVDTTTNGRIKCSGTIPALGAIIGKALSAQVSIGSQVDILTKFE